MNKILTILFFVTLCCLTNACKLPYDDVDLNVKLTPEYAVPLVETDINMSDLFDGFNGQTYLKVGSDGRLRMSYSSRVLETPSYNLFEGMPAILQFPVDQQNVVIPFPSPAGTRIDAIDFKKGFLKWYFDEQPTPVTVTITIPQVTKNGIAFTKNFMISNTPYRDSLDLNGWSCVPTLGNIVISYQATKSNGEFVSLNNKGTYEITRFESKKLIGYFGLFVLSFPQDSFVFDFFKTWRPNGKIRFTEPSITFNFENSVGISSRILTSLAETENKVGERLALQSPLTTGFNIENPSLSQNGESKKTTLVLNSKNSNIVDVISSYPIVFRHLIVAVTNIGNTSKTAGFINDDSRIKVSLNLDIPLVGTAESFTVYDTLALDLSKFSEVTNAEFKITTDNGFPIDMTLQGYFVNSSGAIIDSLVQKEPFILRGAPTTPAGTTIGTSLAYNFIKMDAAKFSSIRSAKKVIVKYTVSSTNNGANPVVIYSNQKFGLKLGVRVGVNL